MAWLEHSTSIRKTLTFPCHIYKKVEKSSKDKNFSRKAIPLIIKGLETVEILKEKDQRIKELEKGLDDTVEMLKEGRSPKDITTIPEKACSFMVYVDNQAVCGDIDAPIPSYLKRHLTAQICAICQREKERKRKEQEKKDKEEVKKFHEKKKKEAKKLQKRVNETISKEGSTKFEGGEAYSQLDERYGRGFK